MLLISEINETSEFGIINSTKNFIKKAFKKGKDNIEEGIANKLVPKLEKTLTPELRQVNNKNARRILIGGSGVYLGNNELNRYRDKRVRNKRLLGLGRYY